MDGLVNVEQRKQILHGAFTLVVQLATADMSVTPLLDDDASTTDIL